MANCSIFENLVQRLASAGVSSPRLEARILIANILNVDPNSVTSGICIPPQSQKELENHVQRRLNHEPIDKIIGLKSFYKYTFLTSSDVLSPRPETEILLEKAIKLAKQNGFENTLELGVGSGCVLLSLLREISALKGVGVDVSKKALNVCKKNAEALGVEKRCKLVCKSWFDADFLSIFEHPFDLIVSNPPYIKTADIEKLEKEVWLFDPWVALDGGNDGLESYVQIAKLAPHLLKNKGYLLLEIGCGQMQDVKKTFEKQGLEYVTTLFDLAGIARVVVFSKEK
ncbi:MAG: peptide chain release factor N(5)-glutamine methyltransferase [Alphaproteobacteria bacterium]|nr:peptide chain release factor N(5)-glutamine methyltransferase [Alphaproteobacteria bacterium]